MSITTVQLFHRMGRRTRAGDFTRLSFTEKDDLLEAANAALQQIYNALPIYFKEQTQGFVLPGPIKISGVGVTQYGKVVTGITFTAAQFGQTVVLAGDPGWNQIIGTNQLLNPFMGATGTTTGTIYGNALFSSTYPFDRIIGDPQFADQSTWSMVRASIYRGNAAPNWFLQQSVGRPVAWWTQTYGQDQGQTTPFLCLRFAPAPDQAYAVNVRMGFWSNRLTLADYQNATSLVVPDQFIETALIPLALAALKGSPCWLVRGDEKDVTANAIDAIAFLKNQPAQVGAPSNRVFTPCGY